MTTITMQLTPAFHKWAAEHPDELLAKGLKGRTDLIAHMEDAVYNGLLERMEREGGTLAEWLISNDDWVTDIQLTF